MDGPHKTIFPYPRHWSCLMRQLLFASLCAWLVALPAAGADNESGLPALVELLGQVEDSGFQLDLLKGMHEALRGRKQVKMPAGWSEVYPKLSASKDAAVREKATVLALIFGDQRAVKSLRSTLLDRKQPAEERQKAIAVLLEQGIDGLAPDLQSLLDDRAVRSAALRGLAAYSDKGTPQKILATYPQLTEAEKQDAINTLATRPDYALAMISAIEDQKIPSKDLSVYTVRQLRAFRNQQINERLNEVWGTVRQTSKEKAQLVKKYKKLLTPAYVKTSDLSNGRAVFTKICAQCHKMYGEGGTVGPDLTGSNRNNLDYVLENLLDPSAIINKDFKLTLVATADGRLLSGIIREQSQTRLVLQTVNDKLVLDKSDIDEIQNSPVSMMPEGIADKLTEHEIRDLVAYLATKTQVPLPKDFDPAAVKPLK